MNEPDLKIENKKIQEYKVNKKKTEDKFGDHCDTHGDSFIERYKNLARTTSEAIGNI